MAENMWPLPLRVKSDVFLGLKFQDSGALKGQFSYQPTSQKDAIAVSTLSSKNDSSTSNVFSFDLTEATNEYAADNSDGILSNVRNLEDVVQNFLKQDVLTPSRDSGLDQMLTTLNVVVANHWSMVKITDTKSSSKEQGYTRRLSTASTEDKMNLRGSAYSHHRALASMPAPHIVFHLQVYGTYGTRVNSEVDSIIKTINSFGKLVSWTINSKKEDLIRPIRMRTGHDGPECYNSASTNATGEADLSQYNIISIGEDSDSDAPTTFACEDLLPLYYYDLKSLVARGEFNLDVNMTDDMQLEKALEAMKREDDIFYPSSMLEKKSSSGTPSWIYIIVR